MARRDADLAAAAERNGDGLLLKAEQTDFLATYSTGNATAITSGNVTTAVGSGVSANQNALKIKYKRVCRSVRFSRRGTALSHSLLDAESAGEDARDAQL
jgi:hypothetical protein